MVLTYYFRCFGFLGDRDAGISHSTCDENPKSLTLEKLIGSQL